MAHIVTKIYRIIGVEPRCRPGCGRVQSVAIREQLAKQEMCPLGHCKFKEEIRNLLPPKLIKFNSDKNEILLDETVTIEWEVVNAKRCLIKGLGEVSLQGVRQIQLKKSSQIFLEYTAFNGDVYNSEPIEIKVYPLPEILSFSLSKTKILIGTRVEFKWNVLNYSKIHLQLDDRVNDVSSKASFLFKPTKTTTFKLLIDSLGNLRTIESSANTIEVFYYVKIKFSVDKTHIIQTTKAKLKWEVKNATKVYLNDETNLLAPDGEMIISPDKTTTYTIFASNELDQGKVERKVNVFRIPNISGFELPKLPELTPDLNSSFIKKVFNDKSKIRASINSPKDLTKNINKKFYESIETKIIKNENLFLNDVINKIVSTEDILNAIKKKLNYE